MGERAHKSLRILVVEDNSNILRILKELLEAEGHRAWAAPDGETGIEHLESRDFDVVITDLGLPGISGWEVAKMSKRCQSNTPVVAISSWQGKEAEGKMPESGIDVVIWKPFRFDQIKKSIDSLCFSSGRSIYSK